MKWGHGKEREETRAQTAGTSRLYMSRHTKKTLESKSTSKSLSIVEETFLGKDPLISRKWSTFPFHWFFLPHFLLLPLLTMRWTWSLSWRMLIRILESPLVEEGPIKDQGCDQTWNEDLDEGKCPLFPRTIYQHKISWLIFREGFNGCTLWVAFWLHPCR